MFNFRKHQTTLPRDSFARDVAERSVAAILHELGPAACDMSPPELRGYVRAHALPIVREEATQLVSSEWPRKPFDDLVALAMEYATHLVAEQVRSHPVVSIPAPHVRLHAAA
jgi:hypothetical protein